MTKLEQWGIIATSLDGYKAPELIRYRINGNVFNYPELEDGKTITTSPIVRFKKQDNNFIAKCESREYLLGKPHEEFENLVTNTYQLPINDYLDRLCR